MHTRKDFIYSKKFLVVIEKKICLKSLLGLKTNNLVFDFWRSATDLGVQTHKILNLIIVGGMNNTAGLSFLGVF